MVLSLKSPLLMHRHASCASLYCNMMEAAVRCCGIVHFAGVVPFTCPNSFGGCCFQVQCGLKFQFRALRLDHRQRGHETRHSSLRCFRINPLRVRVSAEAMACHRSGPTWVEAPTSAGEWAPVEFGGNLRGTALARASLDRRPGGVLRPPAPRPFLPCLWPELVLRSRVRARMTCVHRPACVRDGACALVTLLRAADGRPSPQVDQ